MSCYTYLLPNLMFFAAKPMQLQYDMYILEQNWKPHAELHAAIIYDPITSAFKRSHKRTSIDRITETLSAEAIRRHPLKMPLQRMQSNDRHARVAKLLHWAGPQT